MTRCIVLLPLLLLLGCSSCGEEWPLNVHLDGDYEVSDGIYWRGAPGEELHEASTPAGDYGASELLFRPNEPDMVLVDWPGAPRWVATDSPLAPDATQFLRGLGHEVRVSFFEDGDRAIVVADGSTMAVQCSTRRERMLDHNTSILEGCRMRDGRRIYECTLDMMWTSREYDADGSNLSEPSDSFWD